MATAAPENKHYPRSDGKPMAETDFHRILMTTLIYRLQVWYASDDMAYVSGNLLLYYERGHKRKHVAPDVFVVKGVEKRLRDNYLLWEEGKGPDIVIELTSSSTRKVDIKQKFALYQDVLKVPEYFLFDPLGDYLNPALQGYRLKNSEYQPIPADKGRLRSEELGLDFEPNGTKLELYESATGKRLLYAEEEVEQLRRELEAIRNGSAS